jgi:hypothetical protein
LYLLLLASLILVIVGLWTRAGLIVSTVLLYSFHEYNPVLLDGGDTLLRLIALILLVSPCDRTFTLSTLRRRLRSVVQHGKDQAPSERTMAIWPYRLLLWQMICIYISSTWEKLSGTTWPGGSAVAIVLHHTGFSRIPPSIADALTPFSPLLTYSVLVAQISWILLLILPVLTWYTPLPKRWNGSVKRTVIAAGFLMHLGITITMDVGLFSFVIFTLQNLHFLTRTSIISACFPIRPYHSMTRNIFIIIFIKYISYSTICLWLPCQLGNLFISQSFALRDFLNCFIDFFTK